MRKSLTGSILLAGILAATLGMSLSAQAETLRVKITNLTQSQIFSPPIVIAHPGKFSVFKFGEPASDALATLAETGNPGDLATEVTGLGADVAVHAGMIMPGDVGIVDIVTTGPNRRISVLAMLVSTNDAFFAIDGVKPVGRFSKFVATAYDSGSEADNEDCDFVPGPPCGGMLRDTATAEGFVHVHSGIHGIADLDAASLDWDNPVALVQIIRRDEQ